MDEHRKNVKGREALMRISRDADGQTRVSFAKAIRPDEKIFYWRAVTSRYVISELELAFADEIEAFQNGLVWTD